MYGALTASVEDRAAWRALPRFWGSTLWRSCALVTDRTNAPRADHVVIADLDRDGREDIAVAAWCITGAGPTGAQPFPAGTIYLQRAPGVYTTDDARDSTFTFALPDACAESACNVLTAARGAFR